eukprot:g6498.t1
METENLQRRRLARQLIETRKQLLETSSPYAPRSLQLDFASIDVEYRGELVKNIIDVMNLIPQMNFSRFVNEVRTLLDITVFVFTVWKDLPTPGQSLFSLKYSSIKNENLTKYQKVNFFVCSVLLPYFFSKFSSFVYKDRPVESQYMMKLRILHRLLDGGYKCLSLTNLLQFLYDGKFRDISERLCGIVCKSMKQDVSRQELEWDVVNQELLWHEFSEAVLVLMPVIGSRLAIDQFRFLKRSKTDRQKMEGKCPACFATNLQNPFTCVPCGHKYCYYCIASRVSSHDRFHRFPCLRCNTIVEAIKRAD